MQVRRSAPGTDTCSPTHTPSRLLMLHPPYPSNIWNGTPRQASEGAALAAEAEASTVHGARPQHCEACLRINSEFCILAEERGIAQHHMTLGTVAGPGCFCYPWDKQGCSLSWSAATKWLCRIKLASGRMGLKPQRTGLQKCRRSDPAMPAALQRPLQQ